MNKLFKLGRVMLFALCGLIFFSNCNSSDVTMTGYDFGLFNNSPAATIAKAIVDEDTSKVSLLLKKNKNLLSYQEPRFGTTLLIWSLRVRRLSSFRTLLELGADVNQETFTGTSATIEAASIPDTEAFLDLCVKHGADVNHIYKGQDGVFPTTALIEAARWNLASVKILVEAGADTEAQAGQWTPLSAALVNGNILVSNYLIFDRHVRFDYPMMIHESGRRLYIGDLMRHMQFDLESNEYKEKCKLIDFLLQHGIDYRKSTIPNFIRESRTEEYQNRY